MLSFYERFKQAVEDKKEAEHTVKVALYRARTEEKISIQTLASDSGVHRNTARQWVEEIQEELSDAPKPQPKTVDVSQLPPEVLKQIQPYFLD